MFRILFLILILASSSAFAQTKDDTASEMIPEAVKLEEFGKATNGYVKMLFDRFMTELGNDPGARGCIVNYGSDKEIAKRARQIRSAIAFRKFDASRITIVNVGATDEAIKTQFWIVPAGAKNPEP
jgi:hypothetical protein